MSIKLSKKNLKELANTINAEYIGGNVYNYENVVFYLQAKQIDQANKTSKYNFTNKKYLSDDYKKELSYNQLDYLNINAKQIAYSCGIYGNSGQLHEITITFKNDDTLLDKFYIYYC